MQTKNARAHWLKASGVVSVIFMSLAISGVAQAIPITFQFAGTIGSVNANLTPPIVPTTPISGTYTFESTAPNLLGSSPLVAQYALSSFSLDVLGRHYTMNPSAGLRVIHVQPGVPIVGGSLQSPPQSRVSQSSCPWPFNQRRGSRKLSTNYLRTEFIYE